MKYIKNKTQETLVILGQEHLSNVWQIIPKNLELKYAQSDLVISKLISKEIVISVDGLTELENYQAINFLMGNMVDSSGYPISLQLPFASKTINGKKLFKRIHGMHKECVVGDNVFEFVIPYNVCKITGIEMINGESCDDVDLEVYDTPTGLISTIPNLKLNQFGFGVCVSKDYYEHKSEYDADLYKDMKIEVHYHAQVAKKIGINFILNELK